MKLPVAAAASAAILFAMVANAEAQNRRAPAKNAASVTVVNARTAPLQELEITTTGNPPVMAAKLAKPLEPGKSIKLSIKGRRGCMFDVRGAFVDDATVENDGVDLCKDGRLRLTE